MKFNPVDFHHLFREEPVRLQEMADAANAKLKEWLDQAPMVYAWKDQVDWKRSSEYDDCCDSNWRARLVCIEEIK